MTTTERTELDADAAGAVLRKACEVAAVDPDGIEMLRFGDHAVFRVDGGRIVSRVGRSPDRLTSVRREVAVAEWLAAEGYPAARLEYRGNGSSAAAASRIGAAAFFAPAPSAF